MKSVINYENISEVGQLSLELWSLGNILKILTGAEGWTMVFLSFMLHLCLYCVLRSSSLPTIYPYYDLDKVFTGQSD
jgi:hypothetical protein